MLRTIPAKIEFDASHLRIEWKDGKECSYELLDLRKACPCVLCRGGHDASSERTTGDITEVKLTSVKKVGRYALQFLWAGGHEDGIFRLDELRDSCDGNRSYNDE